MNTRKYTPGQRLNSAAEIMVALLDRQTVVDNEGRTAKVVDCEIVNQDGLLYATILHRFKDGVFIYTPPKRRVKSERWFAVVPCKHTHDGLLWQGIFPTEAQARAVYPNALAYHCATVEVEVSE
jgi:hypothetical protein